MLDDVLHTRANTMDWYSFLYNNDYIKPKLHIVSYDKFILLFAPKLCSSVVRDSIKTNLPTFSINNDDILNLKLAKHSYNMNLDQFQIDNHKQIELDFESIKNDTIKKDIIILFREPFKRFVSGFTQDFVKQFIKEMSDQYHGYGFINPLYDSWLSDIGIKKNEMAEVLTIMNSSGAYESSKNPKIIEYSNQLLQTLVVGALNSSNLMSSHHRPYLSTIVRFLDKLNRSRNKVTLLNVDNTDISKYLTDYDESFRNLGYINSASELNGMVSSIILNTIVEDSAGFKVSSKIHDALHYEYECYFKILREYQDRIYNPKTDINE